MRRLALEAKVGEPGDAKRLPPKAAPPSTAHDWWADDGRMASPCDGTEVSGLAAVLEEMVRLGAESPSSPFRSAWPAAVSVAEYVDILHGGFRCSNGCFVVALVYLDRAMKRNKEIAVGPLTCHRLLAASLTLAAKFQDDSCCHTAYYADICGVPERELACLERAMLRLLDYRPGGGQLHDIRGRPGGSIGSAPMLGAFGTSPVGAQGPEL